MIFYRYQSDDVGAYMYYTSKKEALTDLKNETTNPLAEIERVVIEPTKRGVLKALNIAAQNDL